ncbi:hypothetical protein [Archangium lipolyticum]|uniref:hypothetical protein n=1 Tax=Archangium lipolyticum TaxID=2970465 RepID=UPI00214A3E74|nr:hypothetical protein [Archangium lipolyticum]
MQSIVKEVIVRKGIVKVVFVLGVVVGGVVGGLSTREAEAASLICSNYCLDSECTCIIKCHRSGSACLCDDTCTVE